MTALQFHILSDSEADQLERTAHNPPSYSDTFTPDDFSHEWWATRDALKQRLELFGDEWQLSTDTGDFMLSESRGDSRWIYVTFVSTRLWRPEFVQAVADLLSNLLHAYRVGCLTELNDDEILDYPLVYLVISSTTVFGHVHDAPNDVLSRFGFPISAQSNDA